MRNKKIMLDDLTGRAHEHVEQKLRQQRAGGISKAGNVQAYVSATDGTKVAIRTARRLRHSVNAWPRFPNSILSGLSAMRMAPGV